MAPITPLSPESEAFYKFLRTLKPGQLVSYAAMQSALGFDPLAHRSKLYRVRDVLKRRGEMVIEVVPKVGVRRLLDGDVSRHSTSYLKRMRSAAARGSGGNASVDYAALSPAQQVKHNVDQSMFGALQLFAQPKAARVIEAGLSNARPTLPPVEVLTLFAKK